MAQAKHFAVEETGPRKMSFFPLVMSVITLVIGGGVFSLCSDMVAAGADGQAIIQAWVVSGLGVLCLVLTFFSLSRVKPDLKGGIYAYAKEGFGHYTGFTSAWGYWISMTFSIISYCPFLFSALGYFFPVFGDGTNLVSVLCASVLVWLTILLVSRGVTEAAMINSVVTISKMVPIVVAVVALIFLQRFDPEVFAQNLSVTTTSTTTGLVMSSPQKMMAALTTTIWVFVGIEGAVAISGRAKRSTDVGKATTLAFGCVLALYVLVSLLALGVLPLDELAQLDNPPMAGLMEAAVGSWGAALINFGVILSMLGSMLGYVILATEVPFAAANAGSGFPRAFGRPNGKGAPTLSLILTGLIIQVFLVTMLFSDNTYQFFYSVTTSLILLPYLLSAAYLTKISFSEPQEFPGKVGGPVWVWRVLGIVGVAYSLVLYAAVGTSKLAITGILYAPGILVYLYSKRERGEKGLFATAVDKLLLAIVVVAFVASVALVATGRISF